VTPPRGQRSEHGNSADPQQAQALSGREREVLTLVARALSNRQIGGRLCIAEGTVKRHLGNIFAKLNAVSRIDAVNKAIAAGVITQRGDLDQPPDQQPPARATAEKVPELTRKAKGDAPS
jgi:DNA-binding CsgD family transcriptional regulator